MDELTELAASSSIAAELHAATGGWPAAARLALDALGRRPANAGEGRELALLHRPGAELYAYLAEEAFARDPPELRELIRTAALFERTSTALCREVGVPDADVGVRIWSGARTCISAGPRPRPSTTSRSSSRRS